MKSNEPNYHPHNTPLDLVTLSSYCPIYLLFFHIKHSQRAKDAVVQSISCPIPPLRVLFSGPAHASHTGLLSGLEYDKPSSPYLNAFAQALPTAWGALPYICIIGTFLLNCSNGTFSESLSLSNPSHLAPVVLSSWQISSSEIIIFFCLLTLGKHIEAGTSSVLFTAISLASRPLPCS